MDDAGFVRRHQAGRRPADDAAAPAAQAAWPSRLRSDRQVVALDVRHRDVLDAVDLAEVVNADDVLVRDLARQQQLLLEAPLDRPRRRRDRCAASGRITFRATGDAQLGVPGLIHGAHAADAEQPDDVVARAELLADR